MIVFGVQGSNAAAGAMAEIITDAGLEAKTGLRPHFEGPGPYPRSDQSKFWHCHWEDAMPDALPNGEKLPRWESMEISSPVFRGNEVNYHQRKDIDAVCLGLRSKLSIQLPRSMGFHVHVGLGLDNQDFSLTMLKRLYFTAYIIEDSLIELVCVPWRRENKHFRPLKTYVHDFFEKKSAANEDVQQSAGEARSKTSILRAVEGMKLERILSSRLKSVLEMDELDLQKCFGQDDDVKRPLLYHNPTLQTAEFRYMASCLEPKYIEAYVNLCLAVMEICKLADGFYGGVVNSELLLKMLVDVYYASHMNGDHNRGAKLMLKALNLERYEGVWAEMKAEAVKEAEVRSRGCAPQLPPLASHLDQTADHIRVTGYDLE